MDKFLLILFSVGIIYSGFSQTIIIQRGDEMLPFDNLTLAVDSLRSGDELYIPGGNYTLGFRGCNPRTNGFPSNVKVFGAGVHPEYTQATGRTVISSRFSLGCSSPSFFTGDNTIIQGIEFQFRVILGNNSSIAYCAISLVVPGGQGISIRSSSIGNICQSPCRSTPNRPSVSGSVSNNIISGRIGTFDGNYNFYVTNNVFLDTIQQASNFPLIGASESFYFNNIFITPHTDIGSFGYGGTTIFQHNLFVGSSPPPSVHWNPNVNTRNIFNQSLSSIFINYPASSGNFYENNFRLAAGSPGNNAGSDGKDIGAFTSSDPKENKVPVNPHISTQMIARETNDLGKLPIKIKVEAQ